MNTILPYIKAPIKQFPPVQTNIRQLIDQLASSHTSSKQDLLYILDHITVEDTTYLFEKAYEAKLPYYQNRVFLRGLIEISNYCKRGCKYCGINRNSTSTNRYRLSKEEIRTACQKGYQLGYRTFVLQGGEDPHHTDEFLVDVIRSIKKEYPDTRITLSLGERACASYMALYQAGADRSLLRH